MEYGDSETLRAKAAELRRWLRGKWLEGQLVWLHWLVKYQDVLLHYANWQIARTRRKLVKLRGRIEGE